MKKRREKEKIFVAMSGGVDSSVAVALLQKGGYGVSGVFIKGYYPPNISCAWKEDRRDAMRVAAILDIPFYTFDFGKEYKKHVIDYIIKEYGEGRTPNPDIMCNKHIKFDLFLKKSLEIGADKIATGHYVKLLGGPTAKLAQAKDEKKDQSYFLWTLGQEQLKNCLFPIGDYTKDEVREVAQKFKLPTADKRDSQGLCFVGEFKMEDFLKDYIQPKSGEILNEKGEHVGIHDGVHYYTIGQRHGVGVGGGEKPYYVVGKDVSRNILTVASEEKQKEFCKKDVEITDINWILGNPPAGGPDLSKKYLARIRYRQPLQKIRIKDYGLRITDKLGATIEFEEPQKAVASGQSLVIYNDRELVGGGVILL